MHWAVRCLAARCLAAGAAGLAAAVVAASPATAIIGGADTPPRAFPFMVALVDHRAPPVSEASYQYCGGTLIAAQWVLTAAHCLYLGPRARAAQDIDVYAGSDDFSNGERIGVAELVIHPQFDRLRGFNDIALIHLARGPRADLAIVPVKLASDPDLKDVPPSRIGTIAGWGKTESGVAPKHLRAVDLVLPFIGYCLADDELLKARWGDIEFVLKYMHIDASIQSQIYDRILKQRQAGEPSRELCTGASAQASGRRNPFLPPPGPCQSDAGGPLLATKPDGMLVQLGIISFPAGYEDKACGNQAYQPFYVSTGAYSDWINTVISKP